MKCTTFDIGLELAELIEQENADFKCEHCKGTIRSFLWQCKECDTQVCTYCLMHHHLHGKDKKELDEQVYEKLYKERDEAKEAARQDKLKKAEEKRIEKANQRIAKEEIQYQQWKGRRTRIIEKYRVGK